MPIFLLTDKIEAFQVDYPLVDLKTVIRLTNSERLRGVRDGMVLLKRYESYDSRFNELVGEVMEITLKKSINFIQL